MKGLGQSIIGVALLMTAVGVGMIGFTATNKLADANANAIRDLSHITETKTQGSEYFYNYFPTAAGHSVHEAAKELGEEGGGVEWSDGNTDNYVEIYEAMQERSAEILNSEYSASDVTDACSIDGPRYDITLWSTPMPDMKGVVYASSPLNITCGFGRANVTSSSGRSGYIAYFNATDNRYFVLAQDAISFYQDLEENWNNADVESEYEGSSSACGTYDYSGAESDASGKFRSDLEPGFQDARDSNPESDGIVEDDASFSVDYTVTEEETSEGGCCNSHCHEYGEAEEDEDPPCIDSHCHAHTKTVNTDIDPEGASASTTYRDSSFEVLVNSEWQNLIFEVDDYTHSFD